MSIMILCGLPGSGKTTVGRHLAKMTSASFIDVDERIEKKYADSTGEVLTFRQIFAKKGVQFFRKLETTVIASLPLSLMPHTVISVGGGAMENLENVKLLKSMGLIIYLKIDIRKAFERIEHSLPAYLDPKNPFESFEKMALKRNPVYSSAADIIIGVDDLLPEIVVSQIMKKL